MKLRLSFLLAFCLFFGHTGFSQIIFPVFLKAEELTKLKTSKIAVALLDTTDKTQFFPRDYNNNIMSAMKDRWTYCKYEFVSLEDAIKLKDEKADVYVMVPTELETTNLAAKPFNRDAFQTTTCYISIGKAEDLKVKKKLIGKNYAVLFNAPTIQAISGSYSFESMVTSVKELQARAEYVLSTKEEKDAINAANRGNNVRLRTQTLYLDKALLDEKMTEAAIKEIYKYPFKIVDEADIIKAIKAKRSDIAFIQIEPMSTAKAIDVLFVKSCDDLQFMVYTGFNRGSAVGEKKIKDINELASRDKKEKK